MRTFKDGKQQPEKLIIDNDEYIYGIDNLFEKLSNKKNNSILVTYIGYKTYTEENIIQSVVLGDTPKLFLKKFE